MTRRFAVCAGVIATIFGLAACGSSSSSTSSNSAAAASTTSSTSATTTSSSSASSGDSAALQAKINTYSQLPAWDPPGPPINPSKLSGKKIMVIPASSAVPFCSDLDADMTTIGHKYGVTVTQYANQGQPSQWQAGMGQALSTHVDEVELTCGLDPSAVKPQIAQLKAAGIKVVSAHAYDASQTPISGLDGLEYAQYKLAGELEADWTILQTHGKGDVLVVSDQGDVSTPALLAGLRGQFAQYCPSCKVSYVYIPIPNWATQIQPAVAGKISSDPNLNYIIPIYDGMVSFVLPAITSANATGHIHVASFNATPSVLQSMSSGDVVTFDVGEDFPWLARAMLDQGFRVLLGGPLAKLEQAPLRIFTKQNVAEAGSPPTFEQGYGTAANNFEQQLWK